MDRLLCTVGELVSDLSLVGAKAASESTLLERIDSASGWIDHELGKFVPVTETRSLDGSGDSDLFVPALLALTSVTIDGVAVDLSDIQLYPEGRYYEHGPYSRLYYDGGWTIGRQNVVIVGRWGMYEEAVSCQLSSVSQTDVATTITVSDGGKVSVGMVLLLNDEQEVIAGVDSPSDSTANLNGVLDGAQEVITLTDGSQVHRGEVIRVDFEQMRVLDISGNSVLVTRGWNGTSKTSHLTGVDVYVYRAFTVRRGVNGTTAAAHVAAAVSRYVAPGEVNWLARMMAGLMAKKADTGFAGRSGNAETGETFYYNEFPGQIEKIKQHFWVVN